MQSYPSIRLVRFADAYFRHDIERYAIAGVQVPIYSISKTLADAFRNPKLVDRSTAIESLRAALRLRKATPAMVVVANSLENAKSG